MDSCGVLEVDVGAVEVRPIRRVIDRRESPGCPCARLALEKDDVRPRHVGAERMTGDDARELLGCTHHRGRLDLERVCDQMLELTGDGPCVIFMTGARGEGKTILYPASESAHAHGAAVETETNDPQEAYAPFGHWRRERPDTWADLPWAG